MRPSFLSAFTPRLPTGIVSHNHDGLVRRRMRLGRRQVVDADVRIYVQEVRAVHTAASDGGMRAAVRLSGMRRACPPCPPDRTRLPHHVGRIASGQREVRARHRRIARSGKIARSRMQLLRGPGCQDGATCQDESVSASLTDLVSPANVPPADLMFSIKSIPGRHVPRPVWRWRERTLPIEPVNPANPAQLVPPANTSSMASASATDSRRTSLRPISP